MQLRRSIFTAFAVVLALSVVPAGAVTEDDVRLFVQQPYVHGVPFDGARALGADALPILEKLLGSDEFKPFWTNIVTTAGFIGGVDASRLLNDFVASRFEGEVDRETFQALIAAQGITGHATWGDGDTGLAILERGVDPSSWSSLKWTYRRYQGEALGLLWSKLTINALSYSRHPRAGEILSALAQRPFAEQQRSNIEEGAVRHAEILRAGGMVAFEQARARDAQLD
jgi:hypothetical protein